MITIERIAEKIIICDVCGKEIERLGKFFEYEGKRNDMRGIYKYDCCSGDCCLAVDRWLRTSKGYPEYSDPEGQPSQYLLKKVTR